MTATFLLSCANPAAGPFVGALKNICYDYNCIKDRKGCKREMIFRLLVALCALLVILEIVVSRHPIFGWEGWYGFYAIWGFVSLFGIVLLGKQLRRFVSRREDYYDE